MLERGINHLQSQVDCNGNLRVIEPCLSEDLKNFQNKLERLKELLPANIESMDLQDKDRSNMEKSLKKKLISSANVICTTLANCHALSDISSSLKFDICIIDEATMCTEISCLTVLQYRVRKLILVGDLEQFPAKVCGEESANAGLNESLFLRIRNSFLETHLEGMKMLTKQYRMHPEILKWPNDFFYNGILTTDPKTTNFDEFPFEPYTVCSLEYEKNSSPIELKITDRAEFRFALMLVCELSQYCEQHTTIVLIAPQGWQQYCKKYLHNKHITQVLVKTVDSAQGQEFDVVVLPLPCTGGAGFLDTLNRINIALTRAKKCLIMCGTLTNLMENAIWKLLFRDAKLRNRIYDIKESDLENEEVFTRKVINRLRKTIRFFSRQNGEDLNFGF
ncbi:uncharacterized protein LOC129754863 [Uranotaenia lowii]|uniref:uncharacterized protein LOC129754863 n=1 Tax=Uranotaenia lowii TaxID=190385 RepID=UPI002478DDAA|nr:uncharacterized protein LOC129754863 [Uranotaenia lowii]